MDPKPQVGGPYYKSSNIHISVLLTLLLQAVSIYLQGDAVLQVTIKTSVFFKYVFIFWAVLFCSFWFELFYALFKMDDVHEERWSVCVYYQAEVISYSILKWFHLKNRWPTFSIHVCTTLQIKPADLWGSLPAISWNTQFI